ncbi:MAG TPA: endolytic transglycosylase MltG [Bacillota bacterium]|nr:endolytic transglycosylase MltG [Bacillota bacterium]
MSNDKKNNYRENVIKRSEEARVVRRIVLVAILLITLILAYIGYSAYSYINSSLQPVDPNDKTPIEVEIPLGSTSSSISEILEQNGIIKDARIFRLYTKLKNESDFQAGMYEFTKADNFDEIIETLKSGKVVLEPVHIVTIPEGKSIEEIAELYENNLEIDKEDFLDVVNDKEYINELIDEYSIVLTEDILDSNIHTPLEGYLFPATYEFYEENPSVETVVEAMLDKTVEVVSNYQNDILDNEYSVHEIFTFASLLEKESRNNEERKIIAGVFYNRLDIGMPLQTDPTVLYALGEHKERVLYEDLEVDSPYNTYIINTLPVGPIANFGVSSLEATINPEKTDYMYFLHDHDGNIHYSETNEEHERLKQEYRD